MALPSALNAAFSKIPKRAESRGESELRDTFEDSGVASALDVIDHQIIYGRRGTGKTHALRYLASTRIDEGDVGVYVDLRTVGSAEGIFDGEQIGPIERTGRLLVDLLNQFHDEILQAALEDNQLVGDALFVTRLDGLLSAIGSIRVDGPVELTTDVEKERSTHDGGRVELDIVRPKVAVAASSDTSESQKDRAVVTRRGVERVSLNFSDVARALRELADSLSARRVWIILDEWTSVPWDVQPYLGAFLVRCVLPLQQFTVKIAAIEQQINFRTKLPNGQIIGIELGADMSANLSLDDFMVFEQEESRARNFFQGLLFKHLTAGAEEDRQVPGLSKETDLISLGFTDSRAFDELVRAAEGVPRDAINIVSKAAWRASDRRISTPDVRTAARQWFQTDKEGALRGEPVAQSLLNWIIDNVIREKKARGFLVNQKDQDEAPLKALFDARVLHLVRRGYSAQDTPGERYDVYVIDYGAYVDLINTKNAPKGSLPVDDGDDGYVEVPTQDLRPLRRAVLDLREFTASLESESAL
ncbi:hypothetical protein [Subtercola vilae]|uniref:hypothetical protein n=1 Tax=Subtercola vilae TaxID=2056433 RepID=UPI00191F3A38|nr:hypothetical protein [Subtercola vilae]